MENFTVTFYGYVTIIFLPFLLVNIRFNENIKSNSLEYFLNFDTANTF